MSGSYDEGGWLPPGMSHVRLPGEAPIRVHPGPPRTGLWCDRCLLPSVVEFDILNGAGKIIGTGRTCTDCGPAARPGDDEGGSGVPVPA